MAGYVVVMETPSPLRFGRLVPNIILPLGAGVGWGWGRLGLVDVKCMGFFLNRTLGAKTLPGKIQ